MQIHKISDDKYRQIIENANEAIFVDKIPGGTEHILLVDDEKAIVYMIKQMLESLGYQVTARTSSIEAYEAFENQKGPSCDFMYRF